MTTGRHVHDDDLTLLHYDECRARQQELTRILAMVDDNDTPEPDPMFESQVWRRLQPALRAERRTRSQQTGLAARIRAWFEVPSAGRLAWAGGVAAIALAGWFDEPGPYRPPENSRR